MPERQEQPADDVEAVSLPGWFRQDEAIDYQIMERRTHGDCGAACGSQGEVPGGSSRTSAHDALKFEHARRRPFGIGKGTMMMGLAAALCLMAVGIDANWRHDAQRSGPERASSDVT